MKLLLYTLLLYVSFSCSKENIEYKYILEILTTVNCGVSKSSELTIDYFGTEKEFNEYRTNLELPIVIGSCSSVRKIFIKSKTKY